MVVAGVDEVIDEVIVANQVSRDLSDQASMATPLPGRKAAGLAAGFGKLRRQLVEVPVQHNLQVRWVL